MTRRIVSKFYAVLILLCFSFAVVLLNAGTVFAYPNISCGSTELWGGSGGQIRISITNANPGDRIIINVSVTGDLQRADDTMDHEASISGSTATYVVNVDSHYYNTLQYSYFTART